MGFAADLEKLVEKAKGNVEKATREVMVLAAQGLIFKSPVGNPELWAANAEAVYGRTMHNAFVDAARAAGDTSAKRMGQKKLKETYKLKAGNGYVGGRFRANWQLGVGAMNTATTEQTDKDGNATFNRIRAEIQAAPIGGIFFISNSLPYAQRLEDGWSKQAPAGMVRLTVQELPGAVAAYVRGEL